jgi:hypothetical protein
MTQAHIPQKYRDDVLAALSSLLADRPDATPRKMFGYPGFAVGGKMFVCLFNAGIALKLPAAQVPVALERPDAEPFRPGGKITREWVYIAHDDAAAYEADIDLLEAALAYVAEVASAPAPARASRKPRAAQP